MGERIRETREAAKLSQADVAKVIGVSRNSVSQWENGSTKQLVGMHLERLARLLNKTPEWLAEGKGPDHFVAEPTPPAYSTVIDEDLLAKTIRTIDGLLQEMDYQRTHPIWSERYRSELIAHAYRLAQRGKLDGRELKEKIRLLAKVA